MIVEEYTLELEKLMLKSELLELKENSMVLYLGGLRLSISNVVLLHP